MAMEQLGAGGLANEMKQFYNKKLLIRANTDIVYLQYGKKADIPPGGGKSIEFRRFEKITVTAGSYTLTEGTPGTETNATVSAVTATISQYGMYSRLTDLVKTQSFDPVAAEYTDLYGMASAEGLDVVVRNVLSAATTVQYADTAHQVGTSGTGSVGSGNYLDAAELLEAQRTLKRNGARGPFTVFYHPDNHKDMMEDPDIREDFRYVSPENIRAGKIGEWMGLNFVETNNLRLRTSYGMSGADVYEVLVFGQEFYGVTNLSTQTLRMYYQPPGGVTDPLEQYSTLGWKAAMAAVILNNDFGVLINCASSRSNAS